MLKKLVFSSFALASAGLMSGAASAQSMYAADWTGFYAGVIGGVSSATSRHDEDGGPGTSGDFNQSGFMIGGTAGYNWQMDSVVFGVESDLSYSTVSGSDDGLCGGSCYTDLQAFGTLRARLGYAAEGFMPYVTGGLATGLVHSGQTGMDGSSWELGWAVGGGVEAQVSPDMTIKAEYLRASLTDSGYSSGGNSVTVQERGINVFRVGLNYKFN